MANGNSIDTLHAANRAKEDEFYTQLPDIANELKHYKKHFAGKVVYCNCDDPYESNFFQYFVLNFRFLGLKKLICTCYDGSPVAGDQLLLAFEETRTKPDRVAHKIEITSVKEFYRPDSGFNIADVKEALANGTEVARLEKLKGNGDFRSEECIELLKEADIVVTNPPFSLFREYVGQLMEYEKKFLIIGNQNAITYTEIFPLLKGNKMWLGWKSGDMSFMVPQHYKERATRFWIDEKGQKWRSLGNICWFTNLDHNKRHYPLICYKKYTPEEFPKYDNYDAIDVSKTADIPEDYNGAMGVPITFLNKYCPEQFEILGLGNGREHFTPTKDYINPIKHGKNGAIAKGREINRVLTLATKQKPAVGVYYTSDNSDYLVPPYARILIRRKQQSLEIEQGNLFAEE